MIIRIEAPPTKKESGFAAGVVIKEPRNRYAHVVHYIVNWTVDEVLAYCEKRGWKAKIIRERHIKGGTNHE